MPDKREVPDVRDRIEIELRSIKMEISEISRQLQSIHDSVKAGNGTGVIFVCLLIGYGIQIFLLSLDPRDLTACVLNWRCNRRLTKRCCGRLRTTVKLPRWVRGVLW